MLLRNLDRSLKMSRNKLLIALSAGIFAVTGALAQTSSGNSSNATATPTASPMQDGASGTMAPSKSHKSTQHSGSKGKKTPDETTKSGAAGTQEGQSK
jgi:hypothetical protein